MNKRMKYFSEGMIAAFVLAPRVPVKAVKPAALKEHVPVDSYKKAIQESTAQYNEHRKKAEEQIGRGARLTKHRIDL